MNNDIDEEKLIIINQILSELPTLSVINAGAGSGKTFFLSVLALSLVKKFKDSSILILTFTRSAKNIITKRVSGRSKINGSVTCKTFHSFASSLINMGKGLKLPKDFSTYYDLDDEFRVPNKPISITNPISLLQAISKNTGTHRAIMASNLKSPYKKIYKSMISSINRNLPFDEFFESSQVKADALCLIKKYQVYKIENRFFDYEDYLLVADALLKYHPDIINHQIKEFPYVFVDEFNDCNPCQISILKSFLNNGAKLVVVGDSGQIIYGFAGANLNCFEEIKVGVLDSFEGELTHNRRSLPPIIDLANNLRCQMSNVTNLQLKTSKKGGVKPTLAKFYLSSQMTSWLARKVEQLIKKGIQPEGIAILYRVEAGNQSLPHLKKELTTRKIPYHQKNDEDVPFIHAFILSCLKEDKSNEDFRTILQLIDGIGPKKALVLSKLVRNNSIQIYKKPELENKVNNLLDEVYKIQSSDHGFARKVDLLRDIYFWYKEWSPSVSDSISRLKLSFLGEGKTSNLFEQYDEYFNRATEGKITLSTIHKAKGDEYKFVFVLDVDDHTIPYGMGPYGDAEQEERRVLYTAITRAEDNLFLLLHETTRSFYSRTSRFLESAIDNNLLNVITPRMKLPTIDEDDQISENFSFVPFINSGEQSQNNKKNL